jgi:hypothetical protein
MELWYNNIMANKKEFKVGDLVKFSGPDHSLTPADREKWGIIIAHDPSKRYEKWTIQWNDGNVWSSSCQPLEVFCSVGDKQ